MTSRISLLAVGVLSLSTLTGCVSTQAQADGSTKVNVSVAEALGLKKAPAAPVAAPAAVMPVAPKAIAAAVPGARPAGFKLSGKARANLVQMLSCMSANGNHALADEMKATGWQEGTLFPLDKPVTVFGLPVQAIKVGGDEATSEYHSFFPGVNQKQLIKAARLKLGNDKVEYGRPTKLGVLRLHPSTGDLSISCYIDFEGSYDDVAIPAKKKK